MHRSSRARTQAAEIHDLVQLGAATLACIALLVFMTVSGRDADDPVMRMMADVGAVLAQSELVAESRVDDAGRNASKIVPPEGNRTALVHAL